MAGYVEDFVNNVRNYSVENQFSQLCDYMSKTWSVLAKNVTLLDNALEMLDWQEHSLGTLYIMYVKISMFPSSTSTDADFELIFLQFQLFITQCSSSQIQYATGNFAHISHVITNELCKRGMAIRGIRSVSSAIEKAQSEPTQLTSLHADLCQLCLASNCLKPALKYIDVEMSEIAKENGWFEPKHFLSYYYYSGMIYAALKRYSEALFCFEQAVSCPASVVSHIMLEAFKKYTLVQLIIEGESLPLPKYTSHVVTRFVKVLSAEYTALVQAFQTKDPTKVKAIVQSHTSVFSSDKNSGLVKQVVASMQKRNIQRLTKTFITLSLSDVASRTFLENSDEAELHLRRMIEDDEISAFIDQESEMVSFYDDVEKYNTESMFKEMDHRIRLVTNLDKKISAMDQTIQVNPMYVQKVNSITSQDEEFDGSLHTSSSSTSSTKSLLSKLIFK